MKKLLLLLVIVCIAAFCFDTESTEEIQEAQLKHIANRGAIPGKHKDTCMTGDSLKQFKVKKQKQ
jgi:hypothetical protein